MAASGGGPTAGPPGRLLRRRLLVRQRRGLGDRLQALARDRAARHLARAVRALLDPAQRSLDLVERLAVQVLLRHRLLALGQQRALVARVADALLVSDGSLDRSAAVLHP